MTAVATAEFAAVARLYPEDPMTVSLSRAEQIEEAARAALRAAQQANPDYDYSSFWSLPIERSDEERNASAERQEFEAFLRLYKRYAGRVTSEAAARERV